MMNPQGRIRKVADAEHFRGFYPNGQFYSEPLRYTGLGAYFDF